MACPTCNGTRVITETNGMGNYACGHVDRPCPTCRGPIDRDKICGACGGKGEVFDSDEYAPDAECRACGGTGRAPEPHDPPAW